MQRAGCVGTDNAGRKKCVNTGSARHSAEVALFVKSQQISTFDFNNLATFPKLISCLAMGTLSILRTRLFESRVSWLSGPRNATPKWFLQAAKPPRMPGPRRSLHPRQKRSLDPKSILLERGGGDHLIRPTVRWGTRLAVVALLALAGLTGWLDLKVRAEFEGKKWAVPARVYARPLAVFEGQQVGRPQLIAELKASRYRQVRSPSRPGEFSASSARVDVVTRDFKFWDGQEASQKFGVL